jgi:hypothetical protein
MITRGEEDTHVADLPPYSTPRWVKISGIIVLLLILLVGGMLLTGLGGHHGPRRHTPFMHGSGGRITPTGITTSCETASPRKKNYTVVRNAVKRLGAPRLQGDR